jgi:nucleoid-associated protein YgaU
MMIEQMETSAQDTQPTAAGEFVNKDRWHVVQPGENLTVIAQAYYGPEHVAHWITLYNFNREIIGDNPDLIQAGTELLIPDISQFL